MLMHAFFSLIHSGNSMYLPALVGSYLSYWMDIDKICLKRRLEVDASKFCICNKISGKTPRKEM